MSDRTLACQQGYLPVVYYHHVDGGFDSYLNIASRVLNQQIELLKTRYLVCSIADALSLLNQRGARSPVVAISFDDGYENAFQAARPILKKQGVTATFFVISEYVGRFNEWNSSAQVPTRHMNWRQLKELKREGHEIGSHGASHVRLDISDWDGEREIVRSKATLESELGSTVKSFAFPYGRYCGNALELVKRTYDISVATVQVPRVPLGLSLHAMRRIFLPTPATSEAVFEIIDKEFRP